MIAILVAVCATADARPARPPPMARAKRVAVAWLRAAAKRRIQASPGIVIAVHINACTGRWEGERLRDARDCLEQALAHANLSAHWTSPRIHGDSRDLEAELDTDGLRLAVDMTIDAAGQVTAVTLGEAEIVESF